jgi:hypothetical protein
MDDKVVSVNMVRSVTAQGRTDAWNSDQNRDFTPLTLFYVPLLPKPPGAAEPGSG